MQTAFVLNARGRIESTREPDASRGPLFALARGAAGCAWAVRDDIPENIADELDSVADSEPPSTDVQEAPRNAERYVSLLRPFLRDGSFSSGKLQRSDGPAFVFPDAVPDLGETVRVDDEGLLNHHFPGWLSGEIAAGRFPVMAILVDGYPVSACCCARRFEVAAEAGLDTAEAFRGRGYGPIVTAAWARAVRAEGLTPLYSTLWTNRASLSVARKLGLLTYASTWKLSG